MQEQQKIIQRLHNRAAKIQLKLDNHILRLQDLPFQANPSNNQKYQSYNNFKHPKQNLAISGKGSPKDQAPPGQSLGSRAQYQDLKQLQNTKKQIELILKQYQNLLSNNQSLSSRYLILRQSRRQLFEQITALKTQLQKNREKIQKSKKFDQQLSKLEQQYKLQSIVANKLQIALNNSLNLQEDINAKMREVEKKQYEVSGRLEKQKQIELQTSNFWRDYEKWSKLMQHRNNIQKHIQYQAEESSKVHNLKTEKKKDIQEKIKSIDQVYEDLDVAVSEQEYIIKEIMLREEITSYQLFAGTRAQFGETAGHDNQQQLESKLNIFKNQIGLKETFMMRSRLFKNKTEPAADSQMQQSMRLTAKISQLGPSNKKLVRSAQTRPSLPNQSGQNFPKIDRKNSKNNSILPITHKNQRYSSIPFKQRASFDGYSNKNASSIRNMLPKDAFNSGTENEQRFLEQKQNIRVRTKDGYKYYNNYDKIANSSFLSRAGESGDENLHEQRKMQRLDIVKLYDKLVNGNKSKKPKFQWQQENSASESITERQQQYNEMSYENSIKLKLAKNKRKGKISYKEQIQQRESDNQTGQKSTIKKNSLQNIPHHDTLQRRNTPKREKTMKIPQQQIAGNNIRQRLNTIDQNEEQTNNLGASDKYK